MKDEMKIILEGSGQGTRSLRKTMKTVIQNSRGPYRDSKEAPPEHRSIAVLLHPPAVNSRYKCSQLRTEFPVLGHFHVSHKQGI
jgi:hypothetical protein